MTLFIRPTEGRVTSPFGMRTHPVTRKPSTMHWGVDFGRDAGTRIVAAAAGNVTRAGVLGGYGNVVFIAHTIGGKTYETVYAHLASFSVRVGQAVKQGATIGVMGTTGSSTGVHLHFEIHAGGRWNNRNTNTVNPMFYVPEPGVKETQALLVKAGYTLTVDGIAGPSTISAIKAFQKAQGLAVDGSAGPATMAALSKVTAVAPKPSKTPIPKEVPTRMFKPSSPTLAKGFAKYLEGAIADKTISSGDWLVKFNAGKLSLDDALALKTYIDDTRRNK